MPDHGTALVSTKQRFSFWNLLNFQLLLFTLFTRQSHSFFVTQEITNNANDQQQKTPDKVPVSNKQSIPFWNLLNCQVLLFYIITRHYHFFFMTYYLREMNNGTAQVCNKQRFPFWNLLIFQLLIIYITYSSFPFLFCGTGKYQQQGQRGKQD